MRIRRIAIESFGNLRNWKSPDLDENMVLVYGHNEAGKTTISEFIRSTLFPGKNAKYPVPSKNDKGIIEIEMDSGTQKILVREQKKVTEGSGQLTVSEEFPGLDADTYRSLYGLDLERLTDRKALSSDEIKSKFLTIPGGERLSDVTKEIAEKLDSLMTKEKLTDNRVIGRCIKDYKEADQRLAELHRNKDAYDKLASEKASIEQRIADIEKRREMKKHEAAVKEVLKSQSANLEKLDGLMKRRGDFEKYRRFDTVSKTRYDILKQRIEDLSDEEIEAPDERTVAILSNRERIEEAWLNRPNYKADLEELSRIEENIASYSSELSRSQELTGWDIARAKNACTGQELLDKAEKAKSPAMDKRRNIACFGAIAAGAVIGVAGVFVLSGAAAAIPVVAGVLLAGGGAFILTRSKKKAGNSAEWSEWAEAHGYPAEISPEEACSLSAELDRMVRIADDIDAALKKKADTEARISEYTDRTYPVFESLGYAVTDLDTDVAALREILKEAEETSGASGGKRKELSEATAELTAFLAPYGGEEGYLAAYEGKNALDELDKEIATLSSSIESSTSMSMTEVNSYISGTDLSADANEDTNELNRRIGEITSEMNAIMDDNEIAETLQCRMDAETVLLGALREWAVYTIADEILSRTCDHFYTDLQPDLLWTANRYLSLMTDGKYRLDSDPRENDIAVRDDFAKKTSAQWSSGLGDQIYLSLKMAMAKEMGTEKMPLILDDVLVRFDADRKRGACEAIYEFSKENQVIMFTCDNTLRNYFGLCGKFREIDL